MHERNGTMQEPPLSISSLLDFSAENHGAARIVSALGARRVELGYASLRARCLALAGALRASGMGAGDRVATLAWNDHRHLELYFAVPGIGAVTHTINPRLAPQQFEFIVNHARDRLLFLDADFVELVRGLAPRLRGIERFVVLGDAAVAAIDGRPTLCYEEFLASGTPLAQFARVDERAPAGLCYTSGTTGAPKGVLYTHRSTVLHAFAACSADGLALSSADVVLPIVPMFHANAWGTPFACAMSGAELVLPGGRLDAASLQRLIVAEGVSFAAAVPTVWMRLLEHVDALGLELGALRTAGIGGSAPTAELLERLEARGLTIFHGWGMTETSPLGGTGRLLAADAQAQREQRRHAQLGQGRALYGIERRVVDEAGRVLARDGVTPGRLQVRGHWVVERYDGRDDTSHLQDGWFDTGDVATLDGRGRLRLVDRAKDLIKSGGEWISSLDLEAIVARHAEVAEAAAIAMPHPTWGERPRLIIRLRTGVPGDEDAERIRAELRALLAAGLAAWQLPERIEFVAGLPYGATGKIDKKALRDAG